MEEHSAPALIHLPTELILDILSFLDIPQILAMRQTCVTLFHLTQSISIWQDLLRQQRAYLPFPPHLRQNQNSLDISAATLQSGAIHAYRTARLWPRARTSTPTIKPFASRGGTLLSLEIFLDRWLLCAYSEGVVFLYDLGPPAENSGATTAAKPVRVCATLEMTSKSWGSNAASLDPSNRFIILALVRASVPAITRIYRTHLPQSDSDSGKFELLHTLVSPLSQVARTIDPALEILVLSNANFVDVVAAKTSDIAASPNTAGTIVETRMRIGAESEDLDDALNGIVATRIMGPYIVLFKSRSIELHLMTIDLEQLPQYQPHSELRGRVLEHHFPSITFRLVSSTNCSWTHERLSFGFFGYDFLKGIFHYEVTVRFVPGLPDGVYFDVDCVGVYPMTTVSDIQASVSSHGFVSALALGAQGKRAVWVERRRGSTVREVLVWAQPPTRQEETTTISCQVVYRLESYDLREDLTHCAIGEISGRIVVGNRSGNVFVLDHDAS